MVREPIRPYEGIEDAGVRLALETSARVGVPCSAEAGTALARFCRLFLEWNIRINLGGASSVDELIVRHVIDAFAAATFVRSGDHVLDVGSGGGLPAIPLALLCPEATFELVEPRAKRVAFLRTAVRELGLRARVAVTLGRIEDRSQALGSRPGSQDSPPARWSLVMSRATWAPVEWLARGLSLIESSGGRVMVFTTPEIAKALPENREELLYAADRLVCVFSPPAG